MKYALILIAVEFALFFIYHLMVDFIANTRRIIEKYAIHVLIDVPIKNALRKEVGRRIFEKELRDKVVRKMYRAIRYYDKPCLRDFRIFIIGLILYKRVVKSEIDVNPIHDDGIGSSILYVIAYILSDKSSTGIEYWYSEIQKLMSIKTLTFTNIIPTLKSQALLRRMMRTSVIDPAIMELLMVQYYEDYFAISDEDSPETCLKKILSFYHVEQKNIDRLLNMI